MITKADLVEHLLAGQHGIRTRGAATAVVDDIFAAISTTLHDGGEVRIRGFGTFTAEDRAARTGRNPRTGEKVEIGARKAVKFRAARALGDAMNG